MADGDPTKTTTERLKTVEAELRWNLRRRQVVRELQALMATIDGPRLEQLRHRHSDGIRSASTVSGYKYLDVVFYTVQKLLLAHDLRLVQGPPRRILDIGTGGGHFPFVCRFFGHQAIGIDIENDLYEGIAACLGVQRTIVRVAPCALLPDLGEKFDLITACDVTFNDKDDQDDRRAYWTLREWQFFLNDLIANHLRYPGTLYLKLNREWQEGPQGSNRLVYNHYVLAMAARNGAVVDSRRGTMKLTLTSRREIR